MSSAMLSRGDGYLEVFDSRTSRTYKLPIHRNTIQGSDLARIQAPVEDCQRAESLYNHTGLRLFDPGFQNVAVMESKVTFTDGRTNPPALEYRGHTFQELIETCDFEDMIHLMIWGRRPSSEEKLALQRNLGQALTDVPQVVVDVIHSFPRSTPFYPMLQAGLSAYIGAHPTALPAVAGRNLYRGHTNDTDEAVVRTLAAYAVVLGITYCHRQGLEFQPADPDAPYLNNVFRFLHMGDDPERMAPIGRTWILGCDHEMNNSTATLLQVASTIADPMSCTLSALSSCFGLRHLGAAHHVYHMVEKIGRPENVASFLEATKRSGSPILGVGHRIYKDAPDSRLVEVKRILKRLKANGVEDPLVHIAYEIERQISEDAYFRERRVQVNLDLYWPFIYTALGIPPDACAGASLSGPHTQRVKMWRPHQLFVGERAKGKTTEATKAINAAATRRKLTDVQAMVNSAASGPRARL